MKLLMDGWFPGGLPGGRADAEGPVSAKWQAPLMEMVSGSSTSMEMASGSGMLAGTGPETATAKGMVATTSRTVKIQRTPCRLGTDHSVLTRGGGPEMSQTPLVTSSAVRLTSLVSRLLSGGVDGDGDVEPSRDT